MVSVQEIVAQLPQVWQMQLHLWIHTTRQSGMSRSAVDLLWCVCCIISCSFQRIFAFHCLPLRYYWAFAFASLCLVGTTRSIACRSRHRRWLCRKCRASGFSDTCCNFSSSPLLFQYFGAVLISGVCAGCFMYTTSTVSVK